MIMHEPDRLPSSGLEQLESEARQIPRWGLRQFTAEAGRVIRSGLPEEVWVEVAILAVSRAGSGYTLDLIEPHVQSPSTGARLRVFVPPTVVERLSETTGENPDVLSLKGSCAWVKIKPSFHPSRHLQPTVSDLEPVPTGSRLEQVWDEARLRLIEDGVFCRQRQLSAPADILRIGVVHPERSAGYADVLSDLERLERAGIATHRSFPASFEGSGAQQSLCTALKQAGEVAKEEGLDVLVLVRGGGHAAGLASLVFEDVARLICTFPVPVITGLGHATDRTLLDEVAWKATDTPSKAIGLVLDLIRDPAERVMIDYRTIRKAVNSSIEQQTHLLQDQREGILRGAAACLQQQAYRIESARQTVITSRSFLRTRLDESLQHLERLAHELTGPSGGLEPASDRTPRPSGLFRIVLERESQELERLRGEITWLLEQALGRADLVLQCLHREIRAFSVEGTLARGFALMLDQNHHPVRHVAQFGAAPITVMISDGAVQVHRADPTTPIM
jgi:exodeoxyribonuclease VII large subunit